MTKDYIIEELRKREQPIAPDRSLDIGAGHIVRQMRQERGLTLARVAEASKLHQSAYNDLELGKRDWNSKLFLKVFSTLEAIPVEGIETPAS